MSGLSSEDFTDEGLLDMLLMVFTRQELFELFLEPLAVLLAQEEADEEVAS